MAIYLVRHGETNGNRNRIVQTPDTPLSAVGMSQAQQLASHYSTLPISKILCSDHIRTQQTAAPLQQALGCELVLSELLQERSFGELRGRSYDDIGDDFFAPEYQPINGENHAQFARRVTLAWQQVIDLADNTSGSLLVMTHGLVLRCIVSEILKLTEQSLQQASFENTCVTEIDKQDKRTIIRLCDTRHLLSDAISGGAV
ncbi:histidine phosphatase family protein [Aliiglaciecola sp. LCG003]|uniref:histidine phosphatase family protein n=1 Tax=Aliiglaciecola sp. LCG003 TaxID=3053655 RepID=UPI0025726084|nr:histidine phosphatase family protein [Aliiglaciecola sp. LCG003]WJG09969.1 histidine phosphatase family protein [Aliiglaciecola sp. LCG003]